MYISHSFVASAILLSFSSHTGARFTEQRSEAGLDLAVADETSKLQGVLQRWPLNKVFGKRQAEVEAFVELQCPRDDLYIVVLNSAPATAIQTFCNILLDMGPATVTVLNTAVITNLTSATTNPVQILATQTVTGTATITPVAVLRRDANLAAQLLVANEIISDVVSHGPDATVLAMATPNSRRAEAVAGLENACSCASVAPLSTTTVTNTVWNQAVTVVAGSNKTTSATGFAAASIPATITSPPSVVVVASGSVLPVSLPSASSRPAVPVVIGIPFACPKDGSDNDKANALSPQFIVGDLRYEYSVLCDTAIADTNVLAGIQNVANETACAAECSLVNNVAQRQLCQSASFVPNPDASDGECFLHGPASNFERRPGSVTILLTEVSSKSDRCQSVDLVNGPRNTTVDTAQLVGDIITKGFSLSTPGLISRSETGGVFKTFWSSGSTDSMGIYHYSWFEVYASSSAWWAAYATSWSCTVKNTPQTAVVREPVQSNTFLSVDVTYVVDNSTTTIYSGTSTYTRNEGGGVILPTSVPALGTGGSGAFTTFYSTETSNATAGAGVDVPSPTLSASGNLISVSDAEQTSDTAPGTASLGFANAAVSGNAVTWNSTQGGGVIPPSAAAQSNSTAKSGAQSSGGNGFSIAGGISAGFSTAGSGVIPPSPTNASVVGSVSSALEGLASSSGSPQSSSEASSSVFVLPPQPGYDRPKASSAAASPSDVSSIVPSPIATDSSAVVSNTIVSVGAQNFTLSGATAVASAAQGFGVIPPSGTAPASQAPALGFNGSVSQGTGFAAASGASSVFLSTGGSGFIPPASANVTIASETASAVAPTPSTNTTEGEEENGGSFGAFNFSDEVAEGTTELSDVASTGAIPLPSANVSLPASASAVQSSSLNSIVPSGTAAFATSGATSFASAASGNGIILPSSNLTVVLPSSNITVELPSSNITVELPSSNLTVELTSSNLTVVLPLSNLTVVLPLSNSTTTPVEAALNSTIPSGTAAFATSGATGSASVASGNGVILPSSNLTATPVEAALNGTIPSGTAAFATSGATGFASVASGNGVVLPSSNLTATPVESALNNTILSGTAAFATSGATGSASIASGNSVILPLSNLTATPVEAALNSTIPSGTAAFATSGATGSASIASGNGVVLPSSNLTATPVGSASVFSGAQNISLSEATTIILSTGTGGVMLPTVNLTTGTAASLSPSPSANVTSVDEDEFSNSLGNRTRGPRTSTPVGTAPLVTAFLESGIPSPVAANSTAVPTSTFLLPNNAYESRLSSEVASIEQSVLSIAANSSAAFPTASGNVEQPSVTFPPLSANSSALFPTASGSNGSDFENEFGDRSGRPRSRTSGISGSSPLPTSNVTLSGTAPIPTANSSLPGSAPLTAASVAFSTSAVLNLTHLYGPTGGSVSVEITNATISPSGIPVPTGNFSVLATGPSSVLIQSSNVISVALLTAPTGTVPASAPETGNFSASEGPRRGSISRSSANSTAFLPTGTAPVPLFTAASVAIAGSSASANVTFAVGTGVLSASPIPSVNASIAASSASANVTFAVGTGVLSASPIPSVNVSIPLSTGVTLNVTTSFATGTAASTGVAAASLNSTLASLNSSTADCPTPTAIIIPHTIISYETLYVGPSTCAPTASVPLLLNVTLPTVTEIFPTSTPVPTLIARTYRRSGEIATQGQIDQACKDFSNIVVNPDFEFAIDNTAFGWTTTADDSSITFRTENSTTSNGSNARVLASSTSAALTISQPITLCPGKQYRLTSSNRVANLVSKCRAVYFIGNDWVDTASPQESYLRKQQFFTAGSTPADVSQDLRIVVQCDGEAGRVAGMNRDGFMTLDIVNVGVQQV